MSMPRNKVCPHHDPPFDFIYNCFISASKVTLALANRSGGKTMAFAILSCLDSVANDQCESANLGAIKAQAQRCYRYMQGFINNSQVFQGFTKGDPTITKSDFINGSSIEVLVATMSGVNSPHPQKLKMDEIELIAWPIIQEAFSMVQSKGDVKGVTVLGSTRKFATGPMQKFVDTGEKKGMRIFQWCIWDVMQKWPVDTNMQQEIQETFKADLPEYVMANADGYYLWEDAMEKYGTLDRDIWDTQWLSKKPDLSALIYSRFDDVKNIEMNFSLTLKEVREGLKQIYVFEDFGNSKDHPDVMLYICVDTETQAVTVFDELYVHSMSSIAMVNEFKKKLTEYGLTIGDLSGWVPDHHMLTQVIDRKNMGLPILDQIDDTVVKNPQQLYMIINGIPVVRKFLDDGKLKITPNCIQLRAEFLSYARKRKPNGEYADEPEKKYDHGPDAVRYGLINLFPHIAVGTFGGEAVGAAPTPTALADPDIKAENDKVGEYADPEEDYLGEGSGITGGLMGKTF
jgi:hypothetical protein